MKLRSLCSKRSILIIMVLTITVGTLIVVASGASASRLDYRQNGDRTEIEFQDASREQVLARLLTDQGTKVTWINGDYAAEKISGRMVGSFGEVLAKFLRSSNFVIIYREQGNLRRIAEIVMLGKQPDGSVSPSLRAVEQAFGPSPAGRSLSAEEKLGQLSKAEIDQVAISAAEYMRRVDGQNLWQQNAANAHLDQLARMVAGAENIPSIRGRGDSSAGLPPYFTEPAPTDPDAYSKKAAALTQMMALRNLNALRNSLDALQNR